MGGGKIPGPPPISLHGFACASCMEPGNNTKPVERTVATVNTAAMKIFLFNLTLKDGYESNRIFELGRI